MNNSEPIAVYHLGVDTDGNLKDLNNKALNAEAYSRMKYGVRSDLKTFARLLAAELKDKAPQLFTANEPPAIATSYKAAAPPATTVARYCLDAINLERVKNGVQPGEMVHVYRPTDYIQEYAILPAEERKKLMGDQAENTLRGFDLSGHQPVILDDIHVTGTYTAMMKGVLKDYENIVCAYLITCDDSVKQMPQVEGKLNTSHINKPSDLLPYIEKDDFVFTRRFLKMLIRTDVHELTTVVNALPDELLEQVARGIVDTDAALPELFPEACQIILGATEKRNVF
jgi:hypothetical protein